MPEISFIIEGLGYGHAARMLPVVEKTGGKVITYGQGAEFFREKKVDVVEVEQPYDLKFDENGLDVASSIAEILKRFNPGTLTRSKEIIEKSDIVVIDSSMFGLLLSTMLNKKIIFISNNTDNSIFFSGVHKTIIKGFDKFFHASFSNGNTIAIPDFPMPYSICARNIRQNLPKNTVFLGPVVDLSGIRKWKNSTVVINQGAGYNTDTDIIGVARKMKDYNFVAKGPKSKDGNIVFMEYVRDFMGGSMANILHGGHTTIMESIMLRRPMVCIPNSNYQERINNSLMVKELGIGECLDPGEVNEFSLSLAIEKARRLRKSIDSFYRVGKKMNGAKRLVSLIESSL
jgi:uncharacterized protein (TIGR00661 family)